MAGIDTGNGGFEIDGKVYEFDVGPPDAPGLDPVNKDPGDIHIDNDKKDLGKKTRKKLGEYLSGVTKGKQGSTNSGPNDFPVDDSQKEVSLTDPNTKLPTSLEDQVNDPQFIKRSDFKPTVADTTARSTPSKGHAYSPTHDDPVKDLSDLGKGKQGKETNGNSLLKGIGTKLTDPLSKYTSSVLKHNRFTPSDDGGSVIDSLDGKKQIGDRNYSTAQLQSVGVMLSLRGSQEFPAAFQDNVNPQNAGSVAGALLPSPNQLGILKVPGALLEARDALESMAVNSDAPIELDIAPLGHQSWGALNNVEEPWSGLLNIGMIAMALALQVALLLVFEGLGALIGMLGNGGGTPVSAARRSDGRYTLGSYLRAPGSSPSASSGFPPDIISLLGLHGTNFPFGDALKVGAVAFFVGADKAKEGVGGQLAGAVQGAAANALSDNSSSGFLIIVSRLIIRSVQQVAADVSKIGKAFASNPVSGVKSIIGLIDNFRHSKLIAAINIFTTLGDAILNEGEFTKDPEATGTDKGTTSTIDSQNDDAPGASVRKNRLTKSLTQKLKLSWASNRAPASYLLPDSVATMTLVDTKLGSFRGPMGSTDPDSKGFLLVQSAEERKNVGPKIPYESTDPTGIDVKKIEARLESEYMPFYFHDLRTNEIIGFHAFLASLTDDYTANWETVEGYGRVDPVKIYKSTGRRIGMSFYVIATSDLDFDDMWMKLNKLVTLVYPQYTKGRLLTDDTTTFVQPFSQLIGASPLIRIRLGDLFRSNYSRFALARLFGAADDDMKLDSEIKFSGALNIIQNVKTALGKAIEDASNRWHLKTPDWPAADAASVGSGMAAAVGGGPSTPDQAPTLAIEAGDLPYFTFKVKKLVNNNATAIVEPQLMEIPDMVEQYGFDSSVAIGKSLELGSKYSDKNTTKTKVVGGKNGYAVPVSAMTLTAKSFKTLVKNSGGAEAIDSIDKLTAFLDIEKNALVKSFRSVQGKGLGGVIESMNFDWYDRITWEIKPGHRAPKMCKVTITFAPIHDISPGIDHMGYNRAPLYPVGGAMGQGFDPDKST